MVPYHYNIKSYRVIDGDTIEVDLDLGFRITHNVNVRINGINTPEVRGAEHPAGELAKLFVERWFIKYGLHSIACHSYELGKYAGRILGNFVATCALGQYTLSTCLLAEGLAKPYDGTGTMERFSPDEVQHIVEFFT